MIISCYFVSDLLFSQQTYKFATINGSSHFARGGPPVTCTTLFFSSQKSINFFSLASLSVSLFYFYFPFSLSLFCHLLPSLFYFFVCIFLVFLRIFISLSVIVKMIISLSCCRENLRRGNNRFQGRDF